MRKGLFALFFLTFSCLLFAQQPMDDAAVLKLIWAQMSDDAIVNVINSRPGSYDTSADAIAALKKAGASQRVISTIIAKASISAPVSTAPSSTPPATADPPVTPAKSQTPVALATLPATPPPTPLAPPTAPAQAQAPLALAAPPPSPSPTLLDGTPVKLRLSQTMSSADAKVGQDVPFEVVEDVKVDDVVVIPKGATAIGNVTDANPKKSMGRAGKLDITISYVRLADQEKAALRAVQDVKGGGHVGAMTGAIVATSIVFFPAAPLFLFVHGKDITIPQGTEITAFVEGDMHLDMAKFGVAPPKPANDNQATEAQANLVIDSSPPGADIEVDGSFVGDTPSTVTVKPGSHDIKITKKEFGDWSRKLNVTGGNIHLSAELEAAAPAPASPPAMSQPAAPETAPAPAPQ